MEPLLAIGAYQPIAFPAPVFLMQLLLVLGFYIHAIPMNLALMGGAVAAVSLIYGRLQQCSYSTRLGESIARGLPLFTSLAITNGIVPLLFLQVLYGPLVYPSSIAMAVPWFSILFLLALGYYSIYAFVYKGKALADKGPWLLIFASMVFMVIAYFFTNNMTLMLTPEKIMGLYQGNPTGWNLNTTEPTLIPRYLHFVLGALAVNGLLIGCFGLYQQKRDQEFSNWLLSRGAGLFLAVTLLQFIVGPWFFLSLPAEVQGQFLGGSMRATGPFALALVLDLIAILSMSVAAVRKSAGAFKIGLVSALGIILAMVDVRHNLRLIMLDGIIDPSKHPVEPQGIMIAIFLGLVVFTVLYLIWLGRVVWRGFHPNNA